MDILHRPAQGWAQERNYGRAKALGRRFAQVEVRVRTLNAREAGTSEDMNALNAQIGVMHLFVESAGAARVSTRMMNWARELLQGGERNVGLGAITDSLRALDERAMLRAEEIWNAPDALRLAAGEAFLSGAEAVLAAARSRVQAEKWISGNQTALPGDRADAAFFAHALKLTAETGEAEKRQALKRRLMLLGRSEEECVTLAQDEESRNVVRVNQLAAACRAVDQADWAEVFSSVSFTERALMADPAGVYPRMDEESREALRREVALIARYTGCAERMVASLAAAGAEKGEGVCDMLYTDEGRARLSHQMGVARIPRLTPDRQGKRLIALMMGALLLVVAESIAVIDNPLSIVAALPVAWSLAETLVSMLLKPFLRGKPLLRLDMAEVPREDSTLVVIPALLPDARRARALAAQLETLGALDENRFVDYLLLGDFADSPSEHGENDESILEAVRGEMRRMNEDAGRRKYLYLHRRRVYHAADAVWMGHERKRGALSDLNRLILRGENRFHAEGGCAAQLFRRYRYVLTVDADTEMLPGTAQKLIGAMAHPLNRRYGVIQPRMEYAGDLIQNRFARLMAGVGGADTYHCCAPHLYQDFCGSGIFSGKGIYDVKKFFERTEGKIADNTVLSHDLLEGLLADAAYAGDIVLFEGFPATPSSYLKRQERWTRGDWMLTRYLFSGLPLNGLSRLHMIDNLLRSLLPSSILALLILAVWERNLGVLAQVALALLLPAARGGIQGLKRLWGQMLLLPAQAVAQQGAIVRALYRMLISHKKMLEWVTAADADEMTGGKNTAGIAQAILLLPALAQPVWLIYALPLAAMFVFGREILDILSRDKMEAQFTSREFGALLGVAADTWKYFERIVPLSGNALPPDNLQLEPPLGAAGRTSPTNIGMYMVSCVAARELGLIDDGEMRARLRETVNAVQSLEKWNGLPYNWYDCQEKTPLKPRYVSSVDCGNLLAALVMAKNALEGRDEITGEKMNRLIAEMDIQMLYDAQRCLFRIGYDAENGRMSDSYYDLLASEARILSFVAMAEKGVPLKHWERLARPCVRVKGGSCLVSWSGTMFEYLMPFIFMPSAPGSLLGMSARGVVSAQMHYAAEKGRPWGVSECAYRAFDAALNYQYRAFGVPELALSGVAEGETVAPYASCLALAAQPNRAAENIRRLTENGIGGEYGLYEAVDYSGGAPETVFSYMTHHQGMALAAICNALTGNSLAQMFMAAARERALTVLLNEKPFARPRMRSAACLRPDIEAEKGLNHREWQNAGLSRRASSDELNEGHLLHGGEALAFLMPDGSGFLRRGRTFANLWHGDTERYSEKLVPEIWDETGAVPLKEAVFEPGCAIYRADSANARYEITCCLSPESGTLLMRASVDAWAGFPVRVQLRQGLEVALTDENAIFAHPAFHDLFISCQKHAPGIWRFSRRPRSREDSELMLLHGCRGGESRLPRNDRAFCPPQEGARPLKPCAVWETEMEAAAGETKAVIFALRLASCEQSDEPLPLSEADFARALSLARARARAQIAFCGLNAAAYRAVNRDAVRIFCPRPAQSGELCPRTTGKELWRIGLSGERPLLAAEIRGIGQEEELKKLIARHEYLRSMGVCVSLALIYAPRNEYQQPLRDMIERAVAASHLAGLRGVEGGIYILRKDELSAEERALLIRLNALAPFRKKKKAPEETRFAPMSAELPELMRQGFNGRGGFVGEEYAIDLGPGEATEAPWVNILANPAFGALVTERGGGFIWHQNSREQRLTPFDNDPLRQGYALRMSVDTPQGRIALMPEEAGKGAYRVTHAPGETRFACRAGDISYQTTWFVDSLRPVLVILVEMRNESEADVTQEVAARINWLMGVDARDRRFTVTRAKNGVSLAVGRAEGVGFMTMSGACEAEGARVWKTVEIKSGETASCALLVGWAEDTAQAEAQSAAFRVDEARRETKRWWQTRLKRVQIDTGDAVVDGLINGFCKYQVLASRMFARTGFYQPGGAIGLRDQLQDALCAIYMDPDLARGHILNCAAHQFRAGDGMHWWHEPFSGVRTRISDDILFLPYVCAQYVRVTGDTGILREEVAYLENEEIAADREDWYGTARPSAEVETLHGHCLRALRRADRVGEHGLALMGAGDWNDGMNRVGREGRGESVWLSEFLSCVARMYAECCAGEERDALLELSARMKTAVEREGWDGEWYLRAIDDFGNRLGSAAARECRIDLIAQAWAALNGQDDGRVEMALQKVEEMLVDRENGLVRLLYPPFSGVAPDPGYISAYPAGVRENGGQYTHAVCWLAAAYARRGEAARAWNTLRLLLPIDRTDTPEKMKKYRAEPYVIAADISAAENCVGRAGWTWYTGAAGWTIKVLLEEILGLEMRGDRACLHALLPEDGREVAVTIRVGAASYRLVCGNWADEAQSVALIDDGQAHTVRFSARCPAQSENENDRLAGWRTIEEKMNRG